MTAVDVSKTAQQIRLTFKNGDTILEANFHNASNAQVGISFQGSLSQLAAVLQPVIVAETKRIGPSFTK